MRSTFRSQNVQNTTCTRHFKEVQMSFRVAGARGLGTFSKVSKMWSLVAFPKRMAGVGHFEEDLQRCMSRGRRSTKDMFIRDVRSQGADFPERGCILEHQICRFAKMILRDRCSTSYDLASIFRGRRSTLDRWSGKTARRIGTRWYEAVSAALNFPFLEEVSQNCFVFDVVKFKTWGRLAELLRFDVVNFEKWRSLAELLRFWRCQVQTLRMSRRIAAFLMLSTKKWGHLAELLRFWRCQVQK